ncbi:transposase [Virgibacillus sp. NKC19-3]|nr:transposase [Virgibacillus sp. NKC19-3]
MEEPLLLDTHDLYPIYSISWQVKILFKIWKSLFEIHELRTVKQERLKCQLYGILICILLSSNIFFRLHICRRPADKEGSALIGNLLKTCPIVS